MAQENHPTASLTRHQLFGMYAAVYVVFGISLWRVIFFALRDHSPYFWGIVLGSSLLLLSFLWFHLYPPRSRCSMALFFLCQAILVESLCVIDRQYFLTLAFFFPAIPGFILYFSGSQGKLALGLFILVTIFMRSWWLGTSLFETYYLIYAGYFLLASYVDMIVQARSALSRSQALLLELQDSHKKLQEHARHVEELAITRERNRLARELHDSVSQMLFSITFLTQSAMMRLKDTPKETKKPILQIEKTAKNALEEMRALIFQLRPIQDGDDFLVLLRTTLQEFTQRDALEATLQAPDTLSLSPEMTHHLLRMIQEALHNVVKHTTYKSVKIVVQMDDDMLSIDIEDDGPGFDKDAKRSTTFGLTSMKERAELIGASLEVKTAPGSNTSILIRLPMDESV
ncbi:MAG: hypothetical protein CL920_09430 [Deltaproteobacteria bacterium]|nr:hypothetical protein [Deltaproteobacteria bacterium]MBU48906.1 hypothetical protein [Deltaproteobacteria bacterium]|tara:strand:- start:8004 stop:9203 length:1200 start_codon:yes stop_codon:yes gene_type:complete